MATHLLKSIKDSALKLTNSAMEKLLEDPERATRIAAAAGAVQRGKKRLDEAQDRALESMGFASRAEYKDIGKRLGAAKRRVKGIADRLEKATR